MSINFITYAITSLYLKPFRVSYIAKNEAVLGANSLNNEIERIVDNFNSLKLSDVLDIALNKGDVRDNIAPYS